jgi:RNA polymerase sigma-70 factor, ECF subfamily
VTAGVEARHGLGALLAAAAAGDERAFEQLAEPHRRALHLHCYRMLGSFHDADDALQETLLRAWRGLDRYEPRSPLAAWLHAIATNVCLTAIVRRRRRRELPAGGALAWSDELNHLQPYPDGLLAELEAASAGPEGRYELRESVELAFVAAVQLLPPRQRAVLLLRDVLGWSAAETAGALESSVASVNSALQRARASLERARELGTPPHEQPRAGREADLLRRFMAAWDAVDVDGLVRLLADDALMTMPPVPTYLRGTEAIGRFFATVPAEGRLDEIRLVPTRANAQPALAAYVRDPTDGVHRAYGVMVFALRGERIAGIVGFADPTVFEAFRLPPELG